MRLTQLKDSFTASNTGFLNLYQTQDLSECQNLDAVKKQINFVFCEADKYAAENKLSHKYFELANHPLWENITIPPHHFILKGFDAYIGIDLTETLDKIKPFIFVQNNNVDILKDCQRIEINEDFIGSLIPLQRDIFLEALAKVENETVTAFQRAWKIEQQRIDKWVKTSKINL